MYKNSLNNFICQLSWLKKLCPCSYTSPQNHSWIFETLWVIIFWVRVTHKMLNVNWEKIHPILSVTCHGLRNFAPAHTHPLKTIHEFSKPYELLFSELESLIKCNHKIRVQECHRGRAMSCPWHGGVEGIWGAPFGRHAALRLFHF